MIVRIYIENSHVIYTEWQHIWPNLRVSRAHTFTKRNYSCCDPSAVEHWAICSTTEESWLYFMWGQKNFLSSRRSGLALRSTQPSSVDSGILFLKVTFFRYKS